MTAGASVTNNMGDRNEPVASVPTACLIAEVIGNSPHGFESAIDQAITSLGLTKVRGVDIVGWKLSWSDSGKRNYRVVLKVAYDGALQ